MKNDGGPAFPYPWQPDEIGQAGMSLRDYFAAAVLIGICTNWGIPDSERARMAYEVADAMLVERGK